MKLDNLDAIHGSYRHVYVSPHMDDAVLSCGGRIAMQVARRERVLVVTVFSGIDAKRAETTMPGMPLGGLRELRRNDEIALGRLGVDHLRLDYHDGVFRQRFPLFRYGIHWRARERFAGILRVMGQDLERICAASRCRHLYLPLGIGQHIDHHLAYWTGDRLKLNPPHPPDLSFYEDIPYALIPHALDYRLRTIGLPPAPRSGAHPSIPQKILAIHRSIRHLPTLIRNRFFREGALLIGLSAGVLYMEAACRQTRQRGSTGLQPAVDDVSDFFESKVAAILDYRPQARLFFLNEETLRRTLRQYSQKIGGTDGQYLERLWIRRG